MWKVNDIEVLGHLNVASLNKQTKIEKKSKSERGKKSGLYLWLASSW